MYSGAQHSRVAREHHLLPRLEKQCEHLSAPNKQNAKPLRVLSPIWWCMVTVRHCSTLTEVPKPAREPWWLSTFLGVFILGIHSRERLRH